MMVLISTPKDGYNRPSKTVCPQTRTGKTCSQAIPQPAGPWGLPPSDPTQTPGIESTSTTAPHPIAPLPAELMPVTFQYADTFIIANLPLQ